MSKPSWVLNGEAKDRLVRLVYGREPQQGDYGDSASDTELLNAACDLIEQLRGRVENYEHRLLPLYLSWMKLLLAHGDFGDHTVHLPAGSTDPTGHAVLFAEEERKRADTWNLKITQERPVSRRYESVADTKPTLTPLPHLATVGFELTGREYAQTVITTTRRKEE
jgi:hypothetical protein